MVCATLKVSIHGEKVCGVVHGHAFFYGLTSVSDLPLERGNKNDSKLCRPGGRIYLDQ